MMRAMLQHVDLGHIGLVADLDRRGDAAARTCHDGGDGAGGEIVAADEFARHIEPGNGGEGADEKAVGRDDWRWCPPW